MSLLKKVREAASDKGIKIVEGTATKSSEVGQATQSIASKVDIFYAITDNTIASAIAAMIKSAHASRTPVFGAETSFVDSGAIAAVGFDYYQIGYQTADYVAKVLSGAKPADLPARVATGTDIAINTGTAKKLGITLPKSLTVPSARVVE